MNRNLPSLFPEAWQINNDLTTDLMKKIIDHTEPKGPVIKNIITLSSKTMIDEDEDDRIKNDIDDYDKSFQPGTFGGSSEVDVSLSQTRIELENAVADSLVTIGTLYKQALPLYQEMMNSYSTKVYFDELCKIMRNQHMKYIAAKGIKSAYGISKGIVLFGKDKTSQRNIKRDWFGHERKSKK